MKLVRAFVITLASIVSACSHQGVKPSMTFTSSKCLHSNDLNHLEVKVASRRENGRLLVTVAKPVVCNAKITKPRFRLDGDKLNVSFEEKLGNQAVKCYCDTESTFAFTGLPSSEYEVVFEAR